MKTGNTESGNDSDPLVAARAWLFTMLLGACCWAVLIYAIAKIFGD